MSNSDADIPSVAAVSRAIRDVVISIHKGGNDEGLTINRVRTGAEQKLGVSAGFLKNDNWKNKSKDLIKEAVERYCADDAAPTPSPKKAAKAKPKPKSEPKKQTKSKVDSAPRGAKRKAEAPAKKPKKKRKTASFDDESEAELSDSPVNDIEPSDAESEPPKKPARRRKKVVAEDSDEEGNAPQKAQPKVNDVESEDENQVASSVKEPECHATPPTAKDNVSESDMSDVIDESPVKKRDKKSAEKPKKEPKGAKAKPKATKAAKAEDDPDQAEIKRLQSWLVKCGIRKVWGKELAKCDTSKDKIRHLRDMLKDAGMDGKFSVEKAARIKEQREFAKDLEDIQAGAAVWGETSTGRPRRAAAARPAPSVVSYGDIDSEDGEDKAQDAKDDRTDDDDDDDDSDSDVQGSSGSEDSAGGDDDEDSE